MNSDPPAPARPKVWASLITRLDYLPGLLTLHHSLRRAGSAYPLVALITDTLPPAGVQALQARGITYHIVPRLVPSHQRDYAADPRFYDTWTKLAVFSLTRYSRVVLLDSDMLVRQNMDELMDIPLDPPPEEQEQQAQPDLPPPATNGHTTPQRSRIFAAVPACTCNPLGKPHYPPTWTPTNCAFTAQHSSPSAAQTSAPDPGPLARLNSGLLALVPSATLYARILARMEHDDTADMIFPDQDLLAELFRGSWVPLPYVYNALKTLRWEGVHGAIWRDEHVRNVHYIMDPKPWDEIGDKGEWTGKDVISRWWFDVHVERKALEKTRGISDEF